jgi:hypothetical protein
MTRNYKIAILAGLSIIIVPLVLVGIVAFRIDRYRQGFSSVEIGQSKQTIVNLMGNASEIRSCNFTVYIRDKNSTENCSEVFVYDGIGEKWAIAFDKNAKVIEKYYWFLGEYGNRPPDVN